MKKILLTLSLFLPLLAYSCTSGRNNSNTDIASAISACCQYDGAEAIKLGRTATMLLRGAVRMAGVDDPDVQEVLNLTKNLRGVSILSYDDCSTEDRSRIEGKLERALSGSEMLLEASDSGEKVKIYGLVDNDSDMVSDIILYTPSACALICIKGSVSMESLSRIASDD
ncbi:MAG: DUF4252 domain-containing protein [Bacteroidales bacterium]|nr:DUF4252 domain-containing protein [Bacteroidales bacterium]